MANQEDKIQPSVPSNPNLIIPDAHPYCLINRTTGRIMRFFHDHPGFLRLESLLHTLHIPLSRLTDYYYLQLLFDDFGCTPEIVERILNAKPSSNESLIDLFGYTIDALSGDLVWATQSERYQDYKAAFARHGIHIEAIQTIDDFDAKALLYHQTYKTVVSERLSQKPSLTRLEKLQLSVFNASDDDLFKMHEILVTRLDDDDD